MINPANIKSGASAALGPATDWDKSGTVKLVGQVLILAIFALFDELFIKTNFKCPCIDPPNRGEESCGRSLEYSVLFIVLTTILASFLGTAALIALTRRLEGAKKATENKKEKPVKSRQETQLQDIRVVEAGETAPPRDGQSSEGPRKKAFITVASNRREVIMGVIQFLLVATAWTSILCIDGDYVACAGTCNPYGNATCAEVRKSPEDELPFSAEFNRIKRGVSQPIGIALAIVVAFLILISLAFHCKTQCKDVDKCCAFAEGNSGNADAKITEAKQLLSDAVPGAYIVKNV